ncbi:hypothetical protein [Plasmodium yoelii yoelii]|uniref:Uncharacterized protein n=1 Tax=Plasmodium yoelii yoelii TaxID=73239 RepID=Q7RQP3_PLAYO|nr:hypothetical protein [Plasmodium yoelii yoelii]
MAIFMYIYYLIFDTSIIIINMFFTTIIILYIP